VGAAESVATQEINVTTIKNGEYSYLYNSSESSMYSSMHEAYYHNDKALYKDKGDEDYTLTDLTTYLKTYGTYPFGNSIEGYKVTGEAITSVTKTSSDNDTYTFTLVFDVNKATNNVKIQMKRFGGLDNYPSFKSISISITVKDDYTPVKLELASSYSVKKIIPVNCDQKHTVTYSNFNEEIEIPNLDSVKPLFE
ncbi:MAG: hypothetical protein J5880_03250, partial [Bacilli bacterium]|nr:hypothetical protein [Bacilli bacterium]